MDSSGFSPPPPGTWRTPTRLSFRRLDKLLCLAASYFPLLFVYGTTTWALYTEAYSICWRTVGGFYGSVAGSLGVLLYVLLIWAYTSAVFTSPGTPLDTAPSNKHGYSHLPTSEAATIVSAVTVKSDGQDRFCKKCQCKKPDRTHHCSSCRTCVLKMDHHCPWLANCLGLLNYKAFLLFLIYTSSFCILCFAVSCKLVYEELFAASGTSERFPNGEIANDLAPVNWVLLSVVSGIIGLVLGGFTIWHLMLTGSNTTTIESLEKVRYTTPSLRTGLPPPGARYVGENGYLEQERQQQIHRYNDYLLEESSKKLPHAFDLGRKNNFAQVFGGRDKMWLWPFPMFTGIGDGWTWETSKKWQEAVEALRIERERWQREQNQRERAAGWGYDVAEERAWNTNSNPNGLIQYAGQRPQTKAERVLGKPPGTYSDSESVPLRKYPKPKHPDEVSEDEDEESDLETELAPTPNGRRKTKDGKWGRWDD